jgi:hypothetical protein
LVSASGWDPEAACGDFAELPRSIFATVEDSLLPDLDLPLEPEDPIINFSWGKSKTAAPRLDYTGRSVSLFPDGAPSQYSPRTVRTHLSLRSHQTTAGGPARRVRRAPRRGP